MRACAIVSKKDQLASLRSRLRSACRSRFALALPPMGGRNVAPHFVLRSFALGSDRGQKRRRRFHRSAPLRSVPHAALSVAVTFSVACKREERRRRFHRSASLRSVPHAALSVAVTFSVAFRFGSVGGCAPPLKTIAPLHRPRRLRSRCRK